jgi:hypothetical protein
MTGMVHPRNSLFHGTYFHAPGGKAQGNVLGTMVKPTGLFIYYEFVLKAQEKKESKSV